MRFFSHSIKKRLMASCILLVSIPIIILGILNYSAARMQVYNQAEDSIREEIKLITENAENTHSLVQKKVKTDLTVAQSIFNAVGVPTIDERNRMVLVDEKKEQEVQKKVKSDLVTAHAIMYEKGKPQLNQNRFINVDAVNQVTHLKTVVQIPVMTVNKQPVAFEYGIVDEITETTGVETATIFQVIPAGLLRISTNVKKLDGSRAVGTYIPIESPVYQTVMGGKTYYGRAWVVNAWYKTAYEPIFDAGKNVIGVLYVGNKERIHIVNDNFEIVDKIQEQIGGTATIFQLKDFEGEKAGDATSKDWPYQQAMYRISTNVLKRDGSRATGTIVSKPVYDTIMRGETFFGRAWVVNAWYTTAYEPLKDKTGDICGILYVGVKEQSYQAILLDQLAKTKIGANGYVFILDRKGTYVLSPQKKAEGVQAKDLVDDSGNRFISEILENAQSLGPDETRVAYYTWRGELDTDTTDKLVAFTNFPGWKWTIVAVAYEKDFTLGLTRIALSTFLISLLAILLGIVVSYFISSSFIKPINRIVRFISELSNCRFDQRIRIDSQDEIGIIGDAINDLVINLEEAFDNINVIMAELEKGNLTEIISGDLKGSLDEIKQRINRSIQMFNDMISQVAVTAEQVNRAAGEMSDSAGNLSQGASQQATSLEEITTSMEDMGSQAKVNEETASQALDLALKTQQEVQNGNRQMEAMVNAMKNIQTASDDVTKVIEVIDEIASKTELLALNAAVEAARAGTYGKGFAVVADEIRNLANRSTEAAKNTGKLIKVSLSEVNNGVESVDRTEKVLQEINQGIEQINELIDRITQSSQEQSHKVTEVHQALSQVNEIVQNTSAISEQTASSSENLSQQATDLQNQMNRFKFNK